MPPSKRGQPLYKGQSSIFVLVPKCPLFGGSHKHVHYNLVTLIMKGTGLDLPIALVFFAASPLLLVAEPVLGGGLIESRLIGFILVVLISSR